MLDAKGVMNKKVKAVYLTQNNMVSEIETLRKKQFEENNIYKAPAKLDPNKSMRQLSITQKSLQSFNTLFAIGNIRKD